MYFFSRIFCGFIETSTLRGKWEKSFFVFKSKFGGETVFQQQPQTTTIRREGSRSERRQSGFINLLRYAFNSVTNSNNEDSFDLNDMEDGVIPPGFFRPPSILPTTAAVQTSGNVWIKSCVLTLNGRPLTTLSTIDATEENGSPENFFQFW